jgi:hypothetical protein
MAFLSENCGVKMRKPAAGLKPERVFSQMPLNATGMRQVGLRKRS